MKRAYKCIMVACVKMFLTQLHATYNTLLYINKEDYERFVSLILLQFKFTNIYNISLFDK